MIHLSRVSKRYSTGREALKDVNLRVQRGEMFFLTGRSGAGKTTLLKLLLLLERSTGGHVQVNGMNLSRLPDRRVFQLRRKIGMVSQDHRLLFDRSVFENVALPLWVSGFSSREAVRRVNLVLEKVGLEGQGHRDPISLSIGEQQRVGIARAVVTRPPLLLADEPTGNLDAELAAKIMRLFIRFNQVGVTVLVASHNLPLIRTLGKPILHLENGCLAKNVEEAG